MKIAVYPGSFDPVTNGHLNIIERASKLFDQLIVCVLINYDKKPMFTFAERVSQLQRVTSHLPNVTVDSYDGLIADYAKQHGCCTTVKGLRAGFDVDKEFQMAMFNRKLNPNLESLFLSADHQYMYLSSSAVKEMAYYGADVGDFLPPQIIEEFKNKIYINVNHKEEQQ